MTGEWGSKRKELDAGKDSAVKRLRPDELEQPEPYGHPPPPPPPPPPLLLLLLGQKFFSSSESSSSSSSQDVYTQHVIRT